MNELYILYICIAAGMMIGSTLVAMETNQSIAKSIIQSILWPIVVAKFLFKGFIEFWKEFLTKDEK